MSKTITVAKSKKNAQERNYPALNLFSSLAIGIISALLVFLGNFISQNGNDIEQAKSEPVIQVFSDTTQVHDLLNERIIIGNSGGGIKDLKVNWMSFIDVDFVLRGEYKKIEIPISEYLTAFEVNSFSTNIIAELNANTYAHLTKMGNAARRDSLSKGLILLLRNRGIHASVNLTTALKVDSMDMLDRLHVNYFESSGRGVRQIEESRWLELKSVYSALPHPFWSITQSELADIILR